MLIPDFNFDPTAFRDPRDLIWELEHNKPQVEFHLIEILKDLMENNSTGSFVIAIKNFYNNIVKGDYRPDPNYYIIHDFFVMAAETPFYEKFFDLLYLHKYNPNITEDKHRNIVLAEDLITRLAKIGKFDAIHYLHNKHNLPLDFPVDKAFFKVPITYWNSFHSHNDIPVENVKKFLDLNIYQPVEVSFFHNLNDNNIESRLTVFSLMRESKQYKAIFEKFNDYFFSNIVIHNSLSLENLYKVKDNFNIDKVLPNEFALVFETLMDVKKEDNKYKEDMNVYQKNVPNLNEITKNIFFNEIGLDDIIKENDNFSTCFTGYMAHSILKNPYNAEELNLLSQKEYITQDFIQKNTFQINYYINYFLFKENNNIEDSVNKINFFFKDTIVEPEDVNVYFDKIKTTHHFFNFKDPQNVSIINAIKSNVEKNILHKALDDSQDSYFSVKPKKRL